MAEKNDKCFIEDIKIQPNGNKVVFGTHGGRSYLEFADIDDKGELGPVKSVNLRLSSAMLHVDWTSDGNVVILNSQSYELMWYDLSSESRVNASDAKDFEYHQWTLKLGFPVQGIFPTPELDDVNTVCRSWNREVLATGDDAAIVKLFKWPCTVKKSRFQEYRGHSSHVMRTRFTQGDNYLISAGGLDKTLLVWKTDFGTEPVEDQAPALSDGDSFEDQDDEPESDDDDDDDFGVVRSNEER